MIKYSYLLLKNTYNDMSTFEIAAKITMATEGGYGNSSSDLGGETNFGISKRAYPNLDIKNLTPEKALVIYKTDFWDRYRVGEIQNQDVANQVFDMFFNMDYTKAAFCIQRAVNKVGTFLSLDGIIGSRTFQCINACDSGWLLDAIRVERMKHYLQRITDNKSQLSNMPSWTRRTIL